TEAGPSAPSSSPSALRRSPSHRTGSSQAVCQHVTWLFPSSEHREENFAAHVRFTRFVVGHDSLRRRQHRNSKPVVHPRQVLDRGVNPTPRLRYPLDLANNRLAVEIFQFDLELAAARGMLHA